MNADEVYLESGDKLIGVSKNVNQKQLVIDTEFIEKLKIDRTKTSSISTV